MDATADASMMSMIAALLVLALCCSNAFHIIMARTARRSHELATRCSLGASRAHIISQVVVDGLALSLLGGAMGLGLAALGLKFITEQLSIFDIMAVLLTLSAVFGYINHRFLRLPHTIGLVVIALAASGAMFHYGGEWYWGVDRLYLLERRLAELGKENVGV